MDAPNDLIQKAFEDVIPHLVSHLGSTRYGIGFLCLMFFGLGFTGLILNRVRRGA